MDRTIRAKFLCNSVEKMTDYRDKTRFTYTAKFTAVYKDNSPENARFWEFTPSGTIALTSILEDAFVVGQEYYVDFNLAAVPA